MKTNSGDRIIKDQVDSLQVSFDKEAAWTRLQDRMESRDEKKVYSRVGWAAAAMLVVATVLWYTLSETKREMAKKETVQPAKFTAPKTATPDTEEQGEEKAPTQIAHSQKSKTIKTTQPPTAKQDISLPPREEIVTPVIVVEEKQVAPEVAVKTVAAKPKMKVVHINEVLEDNEREYLMRDRYAVEEYLQKTKLHNSNDDREYKTRRNHFPFTSDNIIQN